MKKVIIGAALSCLLMSGAAFAEKVFVFSPRTHMWYAYENGQLVNSGRASGGANYCRDIHRSCHTPTGNFRVWSKGGPDANQVGILCLMAVRSWHIACISPNSMPFTLPMTCLTTMPAMAVSAFSLMPPAG